MKREEGKNMLTPRCSDRNEGKVAFGRPAGDRGANDDRVSDAPPRSDGSSVGAEGGRLWWVVALALLFGCAAGYWMGGGRDERAQAEVERLLSELEREQNAVQERERQAEERGKLEAERRERERLDEERRKLEAERRERERLDGERRKLEAERRKREQRYEAARAVPTGPTFTNSIGMEFVRIPAGSFQMGKCAGGPKHCDGRSRTVRISKPFYLGKYEVTQAQWKAVMGSDPSWFKGADRPVESVRWDEIQKFIEKLNEQGGHGLYRLPTAAEWEYAARAGSETGYGFGDSVSQLSAYAWYRHNSGGETHPVGRKKPNAWGLYDMYGNVSECVLDRDDSGFFTVRGCEWDTDDAKLCQAAFGMMVNVVEHGFNGFRLALTARE